MESNKYLSYSSINHCQIVKLPKILDVRGNLTFIESGKHVPFDIKRIFYLYDVPTGKSRGAHAHHKLKQFVICLAGSFDVNVDDGVQKKQIHLNRPWQGLLIPPMIWAAEANFDPGSVCLVAVSEFYDEKDYLRNYDEFLEIVRSKK